MANSPPCTPLGGISPPFFLGSEHVGTIYDNPLQHLFPPSSTFCECAGNRDTGSDPPAAALWRQSARTTPVARAHLVEQPGWVMPRPYHRMSPTPCSSPHCTGAAHGMSHAQRMMGETSSPIEADTK